MQAEQRLDIAPGNATQPGFLNKFLAALQYSWGRLAFVVNGNISFGRGVADNIDGRWVGAVTPGVVNTDFTVTHNLNRSASGVILMMSDKAVSIYKSPSDTGLKDRIVLRASAITATIVVFVV